MTKTVIAACGSVVLLLSSASAAVPLNKPVTLAGVRTVCTGIGYRQENNPRWDKYPVRIEFTDAKGAYTAGAHVAVLQPGGNRLVQFTCPGSWALLSLQPGAYTVTARIGHGPGSLQTAAFTAPESGRKSVILRFTSAAAQ